MNKSNRRTSQGDNKLLSSAKLN